MDYECGFYAVNKDHCWGGPNKHKPFIHCIVCGIQQETIDNV